MAATPRLAAVNRIESAGRAAGFIPFLGLGVLVGTVFALAFHSIGGAKFPNDDAYIALHNAQVLWAGHDSAYGGVSALVGATSGVHLALLMLFECFVPSAPLALFLLCAAVTLGYVLAVYALCRNCGCSLAIAFGVASVSMLIGGSLFQFLNGLDTGLAMTAVAWDLALLASRRYPRPLAILCAVMPFVRPELAVLSAGSILILLINPQESLKEKTVAVGLAAAAALPFLAWYWLETGSPIPSTLGAKTYFFAQANLPMVTKFPWFARDLLRGLLAIFPLFTCLAFIRRPALRILCISFVLIVLASYLRWLPSALSWNAGRYLFIFVPIITFAVVDALTAPERWRRLIAQACLAVAILPTLCAFVGQRASYDQSLVFYRSNLIDTVDWANTHIPAGSMVMIHDAGYIAYAGRFRLVDLAGLKTPQAVSINRALAFPSNGANRPGAIAKIAELFQPQYLICVKSWNSIFLLVPSLRRAGWNVTKIFESPTAPSAGQIYEVFALHKK